MAVPDPPWGEEGSGVYRSGVRSEATPREPERGCGLACGFNHRECGRVVGTAWRSGTSFTLWRLLLGLQRDQHKSLLYLVSCIPYRELGMGYSVLGLTGEFIGLFGDGILSCGPRSTWVGNGN